MPKFFTHIENSDGPLHDTSGRDYHIEGAAVRDAGRTAGQILADDLLLGRSPFTIKLTVERADGSIAAVIDVSASVTRP